MHTLTPTPLTKRSFAPFGEVIELEGSDSVKINSGNCRRFSDLAALDISQTGATGISLFDANAYKSPLLLTYVERHPLGSQTFLPTSLDPYLVIVAEDVNGTPQAPLVFYTDGYQGVNYRRNTWHGVLTPIVKQSLFAVVDYIGKEDNLEEYTFSTPYFVEFASLTNPTS